MTLAAAVATVFTAARPDDRSDVMRVVAVDGSRYAGSGSM
jgi:hypothetical protein